MQQRPFKKANSHSASQGIPCLLWNLKYHYHVQSSPILVPTLSEMNLVHTFQSSLVNRYPSKYLKR